MDDGQKIAVYLKHHNIGIVCKKRSERIQLSFYPCQLNNKDVLKNAHIRLTYPAKTISILASELDSSIHFGNIISFSGKAMDIAFHHSNKGGASHSEIRANRDPTAFLQILFDRITYHEENNHPEITKHYHDEIRWNGSKACFRRSGLFFFLKAVFKHSFVETLKDGEMKYKQFMIEMLLQAADELSGHALDWANMRITRKIKKFRQMYNNAYFDRQLVSIDCEQSEMIHSAPPTILPTNLSIQDCHFDIDVECSLHPAVVDGNKDYPSYTNDHLDLYRQLQEFTRLTIAPDVAYYYRQVQEFAHRPERLFSAFTTIIDKCNTLKNEPLFVSRSVHCCLRILQLMHASLLTQHRTLNRQILREEDITLFRFILTENHHERKSLHAIEHYFLQFEKKDPFVLDGSHDFALQYIQDHSREWYAWKKKIECREKELITIQYKDHENNLQRYRDISSKTNPYSCDSSCYRHPHRNRNSGYALCQHHEFEDQREKDKKSVRMSCYERMLPICEKEQKLVAFEHICPQELIDFRDMVGKIVCVLYDGLRPDILEVWTSPRHHDYRPYRFRSPFIQLISTVKSLERSHYCDKHILCIGRDEIIQDNCWNIQFSIDTNTDLGICFERKTLFPAYSPYRVNLSQYSLCKAKDDIDSNELSLMRLRDSENTVVASFESVDPSITLEEYQTIATIRVGECLQLYNIWNAIKSDASLMDATVINIIKQAIFSFGSQNKSYYRNHHVALHDSTFLNDLKNVIYNWLNEYSKTWDKSRYMESLICVLNLIQAEISCEREYLMIRKVITTWISNLVALNKNMCFSTKQACENRCKIIYQLYSLNVQTFRYLDFNQDSMVEYINTIERYYVFKNKIGNVDSSDSHILYENLNKIQRSTIKQHALAFQVFINSPNDLVCRWSNQWLVLNDSETLNHQGLEYGLCFLTGEYRIDGLVCSTIPDEIRKMSSYRTLFGSVSLKATKTQDCYVHQHEDKYFKCQIHFYEDAIVQDEIRFYGDAIVQEIGTRYMFLESLNAGENVLIPHVINRLYKWINMETHVIEFRKDKFNPTSSKYQYKCNTIQTDQGQFVIVRNHHGVMDALASITDDKHDIMVRYMQDTNVASNVVVEVGQSLVFELRDAPPDSLDGITGTKALYLETLDGWVHGEFALFGPTVPKLTLTCFATNETFIMLKRRNYLFPSESKTFICFTYVVNTIAHTLNATSREAYLYLGYTFGFANCATKRDRFTQEYGASMAQTVLENYCYPSDLYDDDEKEILEWIADLSPRRSYYPEHLKNMEAVEFSLVTLTLTLTLILTLTLTLTLTLNLNLNLTLTLTLRTGSQAVIGTSYGSIK